MKLRLVFMCFLLSGITGVYAADSESDYSKGPLFGKNMYIPFLIHYNFPSLPAKSGEPFDLQYHISLYFIQDVNYVANDLSGYEEGTGRRYDRQNITRDYEGLVVELGIAYTHSKQLQTGMDMRVIAYYGGFMDPALEAYHSLLGFPNGGREYFERNRIYINIPNENGITMFLDKPAISFGDIDIWGKWTFLENEKVSLAAMCAFKLPTGRLSALSGSGYPDAAAGFLLDYRAARYLTLYTQTGAVLPFNAKSYLMFNGLLGAELHPWKQFSFSLQMNIKTSPIRDSAAVFLWDNERRRRVNLYSRPQTNILGGLILRFQNSRLQFYLEEDAFTHQGTDITFNVMFSHTINLKTKK